MTKDSAPLRPYVMGPVHEVGGKRVGEGRPRYDVRYVTTYDGRVYTLRNTGCADNRVDVVDDTGLVLASGNEWEDAAMSAANLKGQTNDRQ